MLGHVGSDYFMLSQVISGNVLLFQVRQVRLLGQVRHVRSG
jgi:hypothetical protein